MPLELDMVKGYTPTLEEILEDLGISSPDEVGQTVLDRCRAIYESARSSGNLKKFGESQYEFILCDSTEFFQTFVNMGFGNSALIIKDDYGTDVFFLLFKDKLPEQFHEVVATHESAEYDEVCAGIDVRVAHMKGSKKEVETAERLGIKQDYLEYVQENYPGKYAELVEFGLI